MVSSWILAPDVTVLGDVLGKHMTLLKSIMKDMDAMEEDDEDPNLQEYENKEGD
jgi:hypothetical protein